MDNFFYYILRIIGFVVIVCALLIFTPLAGTIATMFVAIIPVLAALFREVPRNASASETFFHGIGPVVLGLLKLAIVSIVGIFLGICIGKVMLFLTGRRNRQLKYRIAAIAEGFEKPAPELVDELTWLYRQSTLIAEGAVTREGENRAIKEYQAMVKAENKWRAENSLELIEDVTAESKPVRYIDPIVIRKESDEHSSECPCSKCDRQCT